jgi:paraquat-inducible protein A
MSIPHTSTGAFFAEIASVGAARLPRKDRGAPYVPFVGASVVLSCAMMEDKQSLWQVHPKRWDILPLIMLAGILLGLGLFLPVLTIKQLILIQNTFSIFTGIIVLHREGHYGLAVIVFFFSVVFPIAKLVALLLIWMFKATEARRKRLIHWLKILGKWSMLDVFVVAVVIVAAKMAAFATAEPRLGIYIFAFAIFLSMIATTQVDKLMDKTA